MTAMRARNEGSLFRRGRDKRWVATVTMSDGRRRSRSAVSKAEGARLLAQLITDRDRQTEQPGQLKVGAYLARWITSLTVGPATRRGYESIVRNHLEPAFRHRRMVDLSPADVDRYLRGLTLDGQTKRHHRAVLRRALARAVRDGLLSRNVAALAEPPPMGPKERRYLTTTDVKRIITGARHYRLWPLHVLILSTGLRVSEALGLTWSDISGDSLTVSRKLLRSNGEWLTDEPKTRRSRRTIPLIPVAVEALREQRIRQDAERKDVPLPIAGLVFATVSGKPIHSSNVLPSWYRLLAELRIPRVTTHDCRHTTATLLLQAGVPLPVIAEILGHSSIRITADLYAHITPSLRREAADKLAAALE